MHTGIISFCDRVGYNIKSSEVKEDILRDMHSRYQVQILQKHWHRLDAEGINHLYRSPHFACLRSNGNPYYMYFSRYDDVPIIYFIDKKIQPGYHVPRVILSRGKWSETLFDGTVFDGEMVKDRYGGWVFLINDVISLKGTHLWRLTLPERMEYAYQVLEECYTPDPLLDVCKYQVKRYAHATQEGVSALLELSGELPYTSRGLYLWPFSTKFKPKLYNFDETLIKAVVRKVKDNPEFREGAADIAATITNPSPPCNLSPPKATHTPIKLDVVLEGGERVFWLRKTENPDVYDIYAASSHISVQKEGVAHVPSLKVSKMLRAEFKDATVAVSIPFVCRYDDQWNKWLPVSKVTNAVPL